jgi:hypothetical protein
VAQQVGGDICAVGWGQQRHGRLGAMVVLQVGGDGGVATLGPMVVC